MNATEVPYEAATQAPHLLRARVFKLGPGDTILCRLEDESLVRCEVLQTSDGPGPTFAPNDLVLLWLPDADGEEAILLGRLGRRPVPVKPSEPPAEIVIEATLVIEATRQLTLQCGEGSITLRGDGQVLIKGKDLVSRAERLNRIKGAGVAIN
jgi:hypothetical protein